MVKLVATSEGVIPLKDRSTDFSAPPKITSEAIAFARKHGFSVIEYGSDILLEGNGHEIKISTVVECFKLVRYHYFWWETGYPGSYISKERVPTPNWVSEFTSILSGKEKGRRVLDSLA